MPLTKLLSCCIGSEEEDVVIADPADEVVEEKVGVPVSLHALVVSGDVEGVRHFLDIGDVNIVDPVTGRTALHCLMDSARPNLEILSLLLRAGANKNALDNMQRTPLWYAVVRGQLAALEMMLQDGGNVDKDMRYLEGASLLHIASGSQYPDAAIVRLLLMYGFDKDSRDVNGCTPLYDAVFHLNGKAAQLLLEAGSDLYSKGGRGANKSTPAKMICDYLLNLVKSGFDVNVRVGWQRRTLLHEAITAGDVRFVSSLMGYSPDLNAVDGLGMTLLACALSQCNVSEVIVRVLLKADNIDVDSAPNDRVSPLGMAAAHGDIRLVGLLLNRGADVRKVSRGGHTALCIARSNGHDDIADLLVEHGAKEADISTSVEHSKYVCGRPLVLGEGQRGL